MKLKHVFGVAALFMLFIAIHSCTTDYTLSEEDDALKQRIEAVAIAKTKYCKYNVTESSVPNLGDGGIACYPCTNPCAETITDQPFTKIVAGDTITLGYVSGDLANSDGKCKNCPSSGKKSAT